MLSEHSSSKALWEFLKTQKDNSNEIDNNSSTMHKSNSIYISHQLNKEGNIEDPIKIIEKLPTFSKISILQGLLKEMISIKERFEKNEIDMIAKINKICLKYFTNKIGMKEIYDYCESNYPEKHYDYILIEDPKEKLGENYDIIYQVMFLLKNNNDLMLRIIKHCPTDLYNKIADLLVNYFYENTIDSTFKEEELQILIYLILEDYILNKDDVNTNYFNSNILYNIFQSMTKKADVRIMTCSVLAESILKIKGYDINLSIELEQVKKNIKVDNAKIGDENEINKFFTENSVNLGYLKIQLNEYEKKEPKDSVSISMIEYINDKINQITSNNSELFTYTIEESNEIKNYILKNFEKLTTFTDEILNKLKDNITTLPYIIKSINKIIDILITKKANRTKINNLEYQKNMTLSNFLIGNLIIPLVFNPDFNGIITTDIISKITKDNLEIISKVLTKILSGQLFSNKEEADYTIFNKYMISSIDKIFGIVQNLNQQKNFILPELIQNLINTSDNINDPKRKINYDIFSQNNENIQNQSICVSWTDLLILVDLIAMIKNEEKYKNNSEIFEKFLNLKEFFQDQYSYNIPENKREFLLFSKINFSPYLENQIKNILQDNFLALAPDKSTDENAFLFIKCLVEVLIYINKLHKESFNYFTKKNRDIIIKDTNIISLLLREQINNKYKKRFNDNLENENSSNIKKISDNDADFKEVILPQIIETVKYEMGHNLDSMLTKRIVYCSSYLQIHIDELPDKYKENNYSLLIMEIIKRYETIINKLNYSIINQFYLKVRNGEKLNLITSSNLIEIKKLETCICIEYLFDKLNLPCRFNIEEDENGIIKSIAYEKLEDNNSKIHSIQSFIDEFPDFRKYEGKVENITDLEEQIELDSALNEYFKNLKSLEKKEEIIKRFTKDEFETISTEMENYIHFKLYDKLFPSESADKDKKFYQKCCRLDFVKPENLIKDKKMINEKLWETSMLLIREMDEKFTPQDKIKNFGKAFAILQNSITFSSGKNELGIDDTITTLIYVILKSKPKNIFSTAKYCVLLLNPDLSKKEYGILLSQLEMVKNIIYDMKYNDLIGVTEEQFGKDEK